MEVKKSYYAVIPASVRYDDKITPHAKLLYGEITALCNEKGYCWATNEYFSQLYSVSKRTISTWIKALCEAGYISAELVPASVNQKIKIRCLKVEGNFQNLMMRTSNPAQKESNNFAVEDPEKKTSTPHEENFYTPMKKTSIPHEENFAQNNTINTTMNIKINKINKELYKYNSSSQIFQKDEDAENLGKKICHGGVEKKKVFDAKSDPYLLARFLEKSIVANNPKFPKSEKQRQRWARDFDLMIRRDKIDADSIAEVIGWSQRDSFWKSNILSGKKVREKYQQLLMRMNS